MDSATRFPDSQAAAHAWRRMLTNVAEFVRTPQRPATAPPRVPALRGYKVEGPAVVRRELAYYPALRRDLLPTWIVVPQWRLADRFDHAMMFVTSARAARRLRHPNIATTLDAGLLGDGRPFAVIDRSAAEPLGRVLAEGGTLEWPAVRTIALRLCSAVEAARALGLAPRSLDLETCSAVLVDGEPIEVRIESTCVSASARLPAADAPAIAMIIHGLLAPTETGSGIDTLLLRALGNPGYANTQEFSAAIAAVVDGPFRESHGANHAVSSGEFMYDDRQDEPA